MKKLIIATLVCITSFSAFSDKHKTTLLFWGDSLSAAYGIPQDKGWVALIEKRLDKEKYRVINASVSGETTLAALQKLPPVLEKYKPSIVILELGANDGLRGLSLEIMKTNLERMIQLSLNQDAKVLLLGMKIPPNYGPKYTHEFENTYKELGDIEGVTLVPFFLDGIVTNFDLMQEDNIHPTAEAQPIILDNIWQPFSNILSSDNLLAVPEDMQ